MEIILEVLFGSFVGWMLSKPWNSILIDISLGVLGAVTANLIMNAFGLPGITGYNMYSFFVAMSGATLTILVGRSLENIEENPVI